ncbi:unnamed protein product, partial [Mesorhabditis spiculigera]
MVCVPCIILPVLLAIYLKFIQPLIMRFMPERWVHFLDPILYPTCPVKIPPPATPSAPPMDGEVAEEATTSSCCADDENKKTK